MNVVAVTANSVGPGIGISLLVLGVAGASALLPLAACRQWRGVWRAAAGAPLLFGLLWLVMMLAGRAAGVSGGAVWQLGVFGWAMGTMVYMVAVLTIKSILDKNRG